MIPPQGSHAPARPAAPPPGFTDRAHASDSERHEAAPRDEQFEDTAFVEATEHADPYEFRDSGSSGGEFKDSVDDASKRTSTGRKPAPDPSKTASGRLRAVRPQPPVPQPKKTSTRRVKRGPLGR